MTDTANTPPSSTLTLNSEGNDITTMLTLIPALDGRVTTAECQIAGLEVRADAAEAIAAQHQVTLTNHRFRIELLESDTEELKQRLGTLDASLIARLLAMEDDLKDLNALFRLLGLDLTNLNWRLNTLTTELNGNGSTLTILQESFTSMSQTWTQQITSLRSEFDGNIATIRDTLRTHANKHSATAEMIAELTAKVRDNTAKILEESRVRADEYTALAEKITTLTAKTDSSTANLTSQQTAFASELEAYTSSVLAMSSQIKDNSAAFREEISTLASADQALARRVSTLDVATSNLQGRITSEESARISGDSVVLSTSKQLIASSESGTKAKISEESAARIAGDQAEAYQRSLLDTKFTNQGTTLTAAIAAETKARTTAIDAETTARNKQITALKGDISDVSAAIEEERATRVTALNSEAHQRSLLDTKFTNMGVNLSGALAAETKARADADDAEASKRNKQIAQAVLETNAAIAAESKARADAITAETSTRNQQISTLTGSISQLSAAITQEATTRAKADEAETKARNQQISTLTSTIGQVSSEVTQEATTRATADGYLGSRYTLSVSTSGGGIQSVAGMEIASTSLAGRQAINHIAFFADRFYITHSASGVAEAPFMVEGGKVYIKSAVIKEASIDTLQIANNAVTVPVGGTGIGSFPTFHLNMPQGGTIIVIVAGNYLAPKGSDHTSVMLSAVCDGNIAPAIGISLAREMSGSSSATASFSVGPGVHSVTGTWSTSNGVRNLDTTSVVAFGAQR